MRLRARSKSSAEHNWPASRSPGATGMLGISLRAERTSVLRLTEPRSNGRDVPFNCPLHVHSLGGVRYEVQAETVDVAVILPLIFQQCVFGYAIDADVMVVEVRTFIGP